MDGQGACFVLVHGAYHGGWCWDRLAPLLEATGAAVAAPDLPGHGDDQTPMTDLTLAAYADYIANVVSAQPAPATLVGHSMAGAVIAEVAERVPEKLSRLVYLTAYMPGDGESIGDWARRDDGSKAHGERSVIDNTPCLVMGRDTTRDAFYQDATKADLDWVFDRLRPEPIAVFRHRLALTDARFGSVARDYISCRKDAAITPQLQDQMMAALPAHRTWRMDTGHSPFVTAPGALADILLLGEEGGGPRGD